jgi:hypothetical protein
MDHKTFIFTVFSILVGTLVFAIWSNSYVYAQQLPSSSSSPASSSSSLSNTISPELKAKMCDPSNPSLKVVNTTESHICGIPKTIKPPSLSAATPPTSEVSSSSPPQQTTTTKPTAVASVAAPKKQQQQIATTNNNTAVSRSTGGATGATMAPVSNPSNRSLSSSPSPIAPQVKTISQRQQPVIGINSTAAQNYTFTPTSPVVASDKLLYLGYHGGDDGTPTNDDSSSKDKSSSSDTKTSTPHIRISATDNGSTEKKTTSTTKPDRDHSTNDDSGSKHKDSSDTKSSSHNDDDRKSSSSDLASAIRNKVHSIIKKALNP